MTASRITQCETHMTTQHLSAETLNEYLDGALEAPARAQAEAHLADCPQCAARLASWRALFAGLAALPEEPLARDLSADVLARLPQPAEALSILPKLRWIVAAQALAAVVLLASAAPFVTAALPIVDPVTISQPAVQFITELLTGLAAQAQSLASALTVWSEQGLAGVRALTTPLAKTSTWLLSAGLAAAFVLWVLGNGLLLRRTFSTRSR